MIWVDTWTTSSRHNAILFLLVLVGSGWPLSAVMASEPVANTDEVYGSYVPVRDAAPDGFPVFEFPGHTEDADVLSKYLWYHFRNRLSLSRTLFIQEYVSRSDLWLGNAIFRHPTWKETNKPVQDIYRDNLLGIRMDREGYVHTHQHYSHAHEHGWPFPLWPQVGTDAESIAGVTAGWHFQELEDADQGWVWLFLKPWKAEWFYGTAATADWELTHCRSQGLVDGNWRVVATAESPLLTTPPNIELDAFNAPFLQLRWKRTATPPDHRLPYIEWLRDEDTDFSADRRIYLYLQQEEWEAITDTTHTMIATHRHPLWQGKIKRIRLALAPGETDVQLDINAFFTCYDTRHPINNPIFILASANYFRWTGDLDFLYRQMNRMRIAMRYMMTEMGGREHDFIFNTWPGHDGIAGWAKDADGKLVMNPGHGIGNNYYDLLPFGWKDCYSTMQYYAALRCMGELEATLAEHPGWGIPGGTLVLDPQELLSHAQNVKRVGNELFWNETTGRYVACIDANGEGHDYGLTWLGLEAIWYGFATPEHARSIMDWISGKRIVAGDTSTGEDIYRWRFGPRVTTLRNIDWYGQCWIAPEVIPWGGQIQDGGGVVGFAFYDLFARLQVYGPDDAWRRLTVFLDWEREVWEHGGYRPYYADGARGTTLQGGGTAGGIGVDYEFFESICPPSFVLYGFFGLQPSDDALSFAPRMPKACPRMTVRNVLYRGALLDLTVSNQQIEVQVKSDPVLELAVKLEDAWKLDGQRRERGQFVLPRVGQYVFQR